MSLKLQLLLILLCISALYIFFSMIKTQKIYMKYSLTWLFSIISILLFSIFPDYINKFAYTIGVSTPINALFFSAIFLLMLIIFSLTISQSRASQKISSLSQQFAILEYELKKKEI